MTEFVIRLADERGRVMEQTHAAATADELRARFTQAGYHVFSVKARGLLAGQGKSKKVKLEPRPQKNRLQPSPLFPKQNRPYHPHARIWWQRDACGLDQWRKRP